MREAEAVVAEEAARRWPEPSAVPGDLSEAGVRAWTRGHAIREVRDVSEEPCPPWPEGNPLRPASRRDIAAVLQVLHRQGSCVLRSLWLVSYLCAAWEAALSRHEEAVLKGGPKASRDATQQAVVEIYQALNAEPIAFGRAFFGERYARLVIRRARLSALDFARSLAGDEPLAIRDADPLVLALAAQRARVAIEQGGA